MQSQVTWELLYMATQGHTHACMKHHTREEQHNNAQMAAIALRTQTTPVVDPGGFLGFCGTPLFVVLRACVAGLVRAHERSRKQRNPPLSKS